MTVFLLVRHAAHPLQGKVLTGRAAGVKLDAHGLAAAEALAGWLARRPIAAIYSSPLERARETAGPLAGRLGLPVEIADGLHEIDFGEWTGRAFGELSRDGRWRSFNRFRSASPVPGGEAMLATQARMVRLILDLRDRHGDGEVALFGHGDPIKAALAWFLGVPLDLFQRIEIGPASVSTVELGPEHVRVLGVNRTLDPPA